MRTVTRAVAFALGDPRILDLHDPKAYVDVPAGTCPYGEEGETVEIEAPFLLGRYPVTNGQYRAFVDDGGYSERKWWSAAGWAWLKGKVLNRCLGTTGARMDPTNRWSASASSRPRPVPVGPAGACLGG